MWRCRRLTLVRKRQDMLAGEAAPCREGPPGPAVRSRVPRPHPGSREALRGALGVQRESGVLSALEESPVAWPGPGEGQARSRGERRSEPPSRSCSGLLVFHGGCWSRQGTRGGAGKATPQRELAPSLSVCHGPAV